MLYDVICCALDLFLGVLECCGVTLMLGWGNFLSLFACVCVVYLGRFLFVGMCFTVCLGFFVLRYGYVV